MWVVSAVLIVVTYVGGMALGNAADAAPTYPTSPGYTFISHLFWVVALVTLIFTLVTWTAMMREKWLRQGAKIQYSEHPTTYLIYLWVISGFLITVAVSSLVTLAAVSEALAATQHLRDYYPSDYGYGLLTFSLGATVLTGILTLREKWLRQGASAAHTS